MVENRLTSLELDVFLSKAVAFAEVMSFLFQTDGRSFNRSFQNGLDKAEAAAAIECGLSLSSLDEENRGDWVALSCSSAQFNQGVRDGIIEEASDLAHLPTVYEALLTKSNY